MKQAARPAYGLAALSFGLICVASYALQRLYAASGGEVDFGAIVDQVHIPYYWRCGIALLHGGLGAMLVGLLVSDEHAEPWLERSNWLVPLVVVPALIAMLVVP